MPKLQKYYAANADFDKFYFKSTAGLYQSIGSVTTGIYPAPDNELDLPEFTVKNLLQKGVLIRLNAIVIVGGKKRSFDLLCNRLVFPTVLDTALDKTFSITGGASGQIKSLNQRRRQISRG
ncbi:hypothetical protein [Tolypothrix sp. PCC 7601]|uniref:hypothetical protein n=1 Tax=Tolypothrix sp. PCC 7601 TaxID=1188 RepID=UPI0005EAB2F6|nr:hypothetical protein [Tolypothrix sp. PCC 7601]EKE98957.1 hypothetical protein FDUTEX481_03145 [Tolypothrix sp. PCC 7601]UYD35640.1 hypothetical protein HG267_07720 [Tolypothrix sp. PCC 7601]BAY94796.1 hypothetical protein NIES3275_68500 [Microchaete diplosiphon NIES-3275]